MSGISPNHSSSFNSTLLTDNVSSIPFKYEESKISPTWIGQAVISPDCLSSSREGSASSNTVPNLGENFFQNKVPYVIPLNKRENESLAERASKIPKHESRSSPSGLQHGALTPSNVSPVRIHTSSSSTCMSQKTDQEDEVVDRTLSFEGDEHISSSSSEAPFSSLESPVKQNSLSFSSPFFSPSINKSCYKTNSVGRLLMSPPLKIQAISRLDLSDADDEKNSSSSKDHSGLFSKLDLLPAHNQEEINQYKNCRVKCINFHDQAERLMREEKLILLGRGNFSLVYQMTPKALEDEWIQEQEVLKSVDVNRVVIKILQKQHAMYALNKFKTSLKSLLQQYDQITGDLEHFPIGCLKILNRATVFNDGYLLEEKMESFEDMWEFLISQDSLRLEKENHLHLPVNVLNKMREKIPHLDFLFDGQGNSSVLIQIKKLIDYGFDKEVCLDLRPGNLGFVDGKLVLSDFFEMIENLDESLVEYSSMVSKVPSLFIPQKYIKGSTNLAILADLSKHIAERKSRIEMDS
ncbi:MAG: hypothetical protein ACOVOR_02495 [Rhabdochlamydiaceae bacterium]